MSYVFQRELLDFLRRAGGPLGVFAAVFASLGVGVAAMRLKYNLLDPMILLGLAALGLFFSANWAAGAFASDKERAFLINATPAIAKDRQLILAKTLAAASYGLLVWAAAMAVGVSFLREEYPRLAVPWQKLLPLGLFTFCASWANSCIAAVLSIGAGNERVARRLVRGPGLFIVLLLILLPRVLPEPLGSTVFRSLTGGRFPSTLLLLSAVMVGLGLLVSRRAEAALKELRHPLSILGGSE